MLAFGLGFRLLFAALALIVGFGIAGKPSVGRRQAPRVPAVNPVRHRELSRL